MAIKTEAKYLIFCLSFNLLEWENFFIISFLIYNDILAKVSLSIEIYLIITISLFMKLIPLIMGFLFMDRFQVYLFS